MPSPHPWLIFGVLLGTAALVIFVSGQSLPEVMASHFAGSGQANGQMPRNAYLALMIGVATGLPLAITALQSLVLGSGVRINLPNGAYWLAPQRKAATLAFLRNQSMCFGVMLAAFACFVHLCVVDAHKVVPPQLSSSAFLPGLAFFALASVIWAIAFFVRFRRPD
ncbi:MAG: hypothetical protein ABIW82_14350 [Dokdonella sp.]